ncbi:MAG: PIN domain-containing protein [Nanoarchaeota archaeon]
MVCLDSCFLIDLLRGKKGAANFLANSESINEDVFVSSVSFMELIKGANLSNIPNSEEPKVIGLLSSFSELFFNNECALLAGRLEAELAKKGEIIEMEDIMIAATAVQNDESLATRNKKHFEKISKLRTESY